MADQGVWFKLHCSALDDPDLDNLDVSDFGRWAKLGAFIKRHGTAGTIHLAPPARALCAALQVPDFDGLMHTISRFPHVTMRRDDSAVSRETNASVSCAMSFDNWLKYQGDFSTNRVRRFRATRAQMKRSKRRGEKEERKKRNLPLTESPPPGFHLDPEIPEAVNHLPRFRSSAKLKDAAWWQAMIEAYPEIDHIGEMREAHGWLLTKGKGYRDLPGFLRNWFKRASDDKEKE